AVVLPISTEDDFYSKERVVRLMPHFHEKTLNKDTFEGNIAITLGRNLGK
ncbi:MAG TPA: oxidoreductase, partial [Firmicutes bacterium]|nr:oxidoreductase [Bacillota bacterium]